MIGKDLVYAKMQLEQGLTVGIPTETVYGLAGNALDEKAILSIYKIKNRPSFDPLIVHVKDIEQAKNITQGFSNKAALLASKFWPGPLTLLLKRNDKIPLIVSSGSEKVAVRIPNHPLTLELLNNLNFPLVAPSANPFGYISPTRAIHVENQLGEKVSYILDGGSSDIGIESTILDCTEDTVKLLRLGGLSIESIENVLGEKLKIQINNNSNPTSPGQLDKHYAPNKKFHLVDDINSAILDAKSKKIAALTFGDVELPEHVFQMNLSQKGNLDEAAMNLFHFMRELDSSEMEEIYAMRLPLHGLGIAINDRMTRASH